MLQIISYQNARYQFFLEIIGPEPIISGQLFLEEFGNN